MYSMILARESGDEYSIRSCKIHCENPVFQRSIDLVAILGFSCRNRHIRLFALFRLFLCHILFCSTNISHSKRTCTCTCNTILLKNRIWFTTIEYLFLWIYSSIWRYFFFFSSISSWWQEGDKIFFKVNSKWRGGY